MLLSCINSRSQWTFRAQLSPCSSFPSWGTDLPGPVWSVWLSTPRCTDCPCGRRAAGRSWPGRRRRPGTGACCNASPSARCLGSSPGRTAPRDSGLEAHHPLGIWFSLWQCSHLQTWRRSRVVQVLGNGWIPEDSQRLIVWAVSILFFN